MIDSGFLRAAGGRIEYARWGAGGEAPLVLLHEGLGCVGMWRDWPAALARAAGRVLDARRDTGLPPGGVRRRETLLLQRPGVVRQISWTAPASRSFVA